MNIFQQAAHKLLDKGLWPIPHTGKSPNIKGWPDARPTHEQIDDWGGEGRWQNIGVLTGIAPRNLVAVDFDGLPIYQAFTSAFPLLANTLTVASGGGNGRHCHFTVELPPENYKVMGIHLGGDICNIEFKSTGLSIVLPPSIHPKTGRNYTYATPAAPLAVGDLQELVVWAKSFKPEQGLTVVRRLNTELLDRLARHFESLPKARMDGDWINCACPKHQDDNPSFGFNRVSGASNCFVCGTIPLVELCQLVGIDPDAEGGLWITQEVATSAPMPRHIAPAGVVQGTLSVAPNTGRLQNIGQAGGYLAQLDTVPDIPPVPIPYRPLARLGGFLSIMTRGLVFGVVGTSGGGKTKFLETLVSQWALIGVPCLVWSPEWSPEALFARRAARLGAPTLTELAFHSLALYEQSHGTAPENAYGRPLGKDKQAAMANAVTAIEADLAPVYVIDAPAMSVQTLGQELQAAIETATVRPRVFVLDYIQQLEANSLRRELSLYHMIHLVKRIAASHGMVTVMASQSTKDASRGQRNGKFLDAAAARGVADDAFGAFITLNPEYTPDGSKHPYATIVATKNSDGETAKFRVPVNWQTGAWGNELHSDQNFEPNGFRRSTRAADIVF